ncbi:hypothetical protein [Rhizobium laguerreae]|uniref:hypothetical protein n=1 Tax=Rhizobium laguerreae TaxID=1076926 RepID=UPI001C901BA2|nr:hypothetical protein [Rhizobium laguerreae]MBY3168859.1 hypothetical protein [Rhizobium laguerreae]MBY3265320.1 hypothetical protein [Rhizobium laguerreae]MBY3337761.1 hypothetical protein [Rhizobium laguerreae]
MNKQIASALAIALFPALALAAKFPDCLSVPGGGLVTFAVPQEMNTDDVSRCLSVFTEKAFGSTPNIEYMPPGDLLPNLERLKVKVSLIEDRNEGDRIILRAVGSAVWPKGTTFNHEHTPEKPMWEELAHAVVDMNGRDMTGSTAQFSYLRGLEAVALQDGRRTDLGQHFILFDIHCP